MQEVAKIALGNPLFQQLNKPSETTKHIPGLFFVSDMSYDSLHQRYASRRLSASLLGVDFRLCVYLRIRMKNREEYDNCVCKEPVKTTSCPKYEKSVWKSVLVLHKSEIV
jgi:hypothetical protein